MVLGQSYYLEQPTISNHGLDCATLLAKEKSGKVGVVCNPFICTRNVNCEKNMIEGDGKIEQAFAVSNN